MSRQQFHPRLFMTAGPSETDGSPSQPPLRLYLLCVIILFAVLALDLTLPLGVAVVILYNTVILFSLQSRNRRFVILLAITTSVLTIVPLFHKEQIDEMWKAVSNRVLALFSIWVASWLGLQRQRVDERREKAFEEVRVLRGFLPICASCKKIRSMEGSWTLLEKYITEHSEAEFTHGLCPECTRKLFPQFFDHTTEKERRR